MEKQVKLNTVSIIGIVTLVVALVLVRVFQEYLFYDPLLSFFKKESKVLPEYDSLKLFFGLAFRYFLNAIISLAIIYLAFKDRAILKLCTILYSVLFVLLTGVLFIILNTDDVDLLLLFYVRRFLIQPLFLILFLPAFYYQKKVKG
ncbi:MAG: exosortase F system-associated protein [Flavobacterium sp. MedPE-SWcel]|uniref:exosortase F system-associated membrane protein n=1 Tax=uncultured Flavobacterium sp. TaxID=165435 RepID=UPI00091E007B|nr:exosortase F system-associated protein [uncultured Flavobacterium sp.]OIQ21328.1 MAG: exosortase F system-associated protein [Flavobacterium sp. MedPE-SWcel]